MEISSKLADLAKRHTGALTGGTLETLVRGIGESKSKAEEDAFIKRMISLSKQQIKDGIPRKGENTKALKDLLVYLIYIDMLGHEASWASSAIIQLCSHKSLTVKKAAYLATSLLIDPASDLNIMVTATIQADLKSDNFLVVCTALQAISQCHGVELVSVFLPQVLSAIRHDRDLVKKKALLALHRLLQLDPSIAPDVERHLVEKLGYKEPSVMVAALCGLYQLAKSDPSPYRNLVHYFTNILKQVSEGRLGRAWDYHRAPAPFVQIQLLRLLAVLGAGDLEATENMQAVILDVWRRADALASTVGVVLVYECMRTATAVVPTDALLSAAIDSMTRFLPATENNLKYAGVDILSRLVAGDAGRVEQYQLAIVDCLRSPDVTLKRKTLRLLFMMAGPNNVETIATEVLSYLKDPQADDDEARAAAASSLFDIIEQFSPSPGWFAETLTTLLEYAGDVAPLKVGEAVLRIAANPNKMLADEFSVGHSISESATKDLQKSLARRYLALLDKPKLHPALLRIACLVVGEYGLLTGTDYETVAETVSGVPETQATDSTVLAAVAIALGKLCLQAKQPLPEQASAALHSLMASESIEVQQAAVEANALLNGSPAAQKTVLEASRYLRSFGNGIDGTRGTKIDPSLSFLDGYVHDAEMKGAPPYLSLDDRIAMGLMRPGRSGRSRTDSSIAALDSSTAASSSQLKFAAYAAASPTPVLTRPPSQSPSVPAPYEQSSSANQSPGNTTSIGMNKNTDNMTGSTGGQERQELRISKASRKWGPQAETAKAETTIERKDLNQLNASSNRIVDENRAQGTQSKTTADAVDPAKQHLAASLFGGGRQGGRTPSKPLPPQSAALAERDLLGDLEDDDSKKGFVQGADQTLVAESLLDFGNVGNAVVDDPLAALVGLDAPTVPDHPPSVNLESLLQDMPFPRKPSSTMETNNEIRQKSSIDKDPFASLLD